MDSSNMYAALDRPLKAKAKLSSLPADSEKDHMIAPLMAQDEDSAPKEPSANGGTEAFTEDPTYGASEDGWEVIGARKKGLKKTARSEEEPMTEPEDPQGPSNGSSKEGISMDQDDASSSTTADASNDTRSGSVDGNFTPDTIEEDTLELKQEPHKDSEPIAASGNEVMPDPLGEDKPKKSRKRGKKGGKKVQKQTAARAAAREDGLKLDRLHVIIGVVIVVFSASLWVFW